MTRMPQSSEASVKATASPLDRAKRLASTLVSESGEASGALLARELHGVLSTLDAAGRHGFQRYLAAEFQPDAAVLRSAACKLAISSAAKIPFPAISATAMPTEVGPMRMKS